MKKTTALVTLLVLLLSAAASGAEEILSLDRSRLAAFARRYPGDDWASTRRQVMADYFSIVNRDLSEQRRMNYAVYVDRSAAQYGLDPFVVAAVMIHRSGLDWLSKGEGEYGLMRVDWTANKAWIVKEDSRIDEPRILMKPVLNVRMGCALMADRLTLSGRSYDEMVARFYGRGGLSASSEIERHYRNMAQSFRESVEARRP
ncbi:hypothetical protein KAR29_00085 [Aminithiophilus ramosus]|uniref:Transglycosylase SLT domain-containing protein n=2 Tax=Synergistales TaxID=649776 RepID=A0A9Q7AIG9_9BACT|nr:hypothetical protein [Aminithiophilus ramosus]QTX32390.1 hypothetical protein KAR29_00085 [Aminithiophilus ramosus]QVL36267.1 hypothetical protein KIH16_00085 [Synergistota bacterium]